MNEYELIDTVRQWLDAAETSRNNDQLEGYAKQMQLVLDLLLKELVDLPPKSADRPAGKFNPERVLEAIATAIKHRTISTTHRWYIVYYHTRLTCVPSYVNVPPEIILHEFTNKMIDKGFSIAYWNHLKAKVIELYKELEL